jgi:hypothetical protein
MRSPFMPQRRVKASSEALALSLAFQFRRLLGRRFALGEQRHQIERPGEHRKRAVGGARPLLARPVAVKFDAVVIGIRADTALR